MCKVKLCRIYKLEYKNDKMTFTKYCTKKAENQNKALGKGAIVKQASKVKHSNLKKLTA